MFPSDFSVNSKVVSFSGTGLFSGVSSTSATFVPDATNNKVTIKGVCTAGVATNSNSIVYIFSMDNPAQKKTTDSLQVSLLTASGAAVMRKTSGIVLAEGSIETGTVGSIATSSLTTTEVQKATRLRFDFTPTHAVSASSQIVLTVPSSLTLGASCSVATVSGGLDAGATCASDNVAKTMTISSPFGSSGFAGGSALQLAVDGASNPVSVLTVGGFSVATYNIIDGSPYMIDMGTGGASDYTATQGSIVAPKSATPASAEASKTPVVYTIAFTTSNNIPLGGKVKISFPSGIVISDTSSASCTGTKGFQTVGLTCNPTSSSLEITNGFSADFTAGELELTVAGVSNPRSTLATGSFSVTTTDSSDNVIDATTTGMTVTMSSVPDLGSVSVAGTDKTNGASTDYTFDIVPGPTLVDGDYLTIAFPTETTLPGSLSTCEAVAVITTITCQIQVGGAVKVTLSALSGGTATSSQTMKFRIGLVTNPPNTQTSSAFTVRAYDSADNQIAQYAADP